MSRRRPANLGRARLHLSDDCGRGERGRGVACAMGRGRARRTRWHASGGAARRDVMLGWRARPRAVTGAPHAQSSGGSSGAFDLWTTPRGMRLSRPLCHAAARSAWSHAAICASGTLYEANASSDRCAGGGSRGASGERPSGTPW
eukprot:6368997-Prymnesium_polylepis.2